MFLLLSTFGCGQPDDPGSDKIDPTSDADVDADTDIEEDVEDCTGGVDEDGDGATDCEDADCRTTCDADGDGADGLAFGGPDCDDGDENVGPDALEICNTIDDDCDDEIDDDDSDLDPASATDWYVDEDADGFGRPGPHRTQCTEVPGAVGNDDDCDDTRAEVNPDAVEVCNSGADDDCDGDADDDDPSLDLGTATTWYPNLDGDSAGDDLGAVQACRRPQGSLPVGGDCDDTDPTIADPEPWVLDVDGDGYGSGAPSADSCTAPSAGYVQESLGNDCNESDLTIHPDAVDVCDDGIDNDCDGNDCAACTRIIVALLPGWGTVNNYSLAFDDLNADSSAYGTCPVIFVDVGPGFTLQDLVGMDADLVWINDPAGIGITYDANEAAAIRDFAQGGYGGVVMTYLISLGAVDNSALVDLVGVDPTTVLASTVATYGLVDINDPGHPLMTDLPSPFGAATYAMAQGLNVPWSSALLPGASVVAESADGFQVVVGYEGADWDGVWMSAYPEYQVASVDTYQLLYNAAFFAGGY